MSTKKIATPTETRRIIESHDFHWKKSLGQNFIIEPNVIENIIKAAKLTKEDIVVEVGPGLGALTEGLAEAAGQVLAVEIDKKLLPILAELFSDTPNITIHGGDALEVDFNELIAPLRERGNYNDGFVVVANLPYYITTPLMMHFLEGHFPWRRQVLMVQKEVADRVRAQASTKDYGALSLGVQYRAKVDIAFTIPPTVFYPKPTVNSAVLVLEHLDKPRVVVEDEKLFFAVIKASFGQRRKTLNNSLAAGLGMDKTLIIESLNQAHIDGSRRGETLSIEEFAALTEAISKNI